MLNRNQTAVPLAAYGRLFYTRALTLAGGAHDMEIAMDNTVPMTKWEQRTQDDQRAVSRYARRRVIDRRHDEMRLE